MTVPDIRRVLADYAAAARRCEAGGLDGVEIISSMHLPGQFLSPLANRRDDAYGGELDDRARFLLEAIEACRDATGDDFIVGVRFTADEHNEHGISASEGIEVGRILGRHGRRRFRQRQRRLQRHLPGSQRCFPGHGGEERPLHRACACGTRSQRSADPAVVAHRQPVDGKSCHRTGLSRHGRHDAAAHRRSAHPDQTCARRRASHSTLRRRRLLPRPAVSRARCPVHPQSVDQP